MRRSKRSMATASGIRTGTLTLLLLIVAIVVAVVGVLAMQTARSNDARADAFTNNVTQFYKNDAAAQQLLAQLDEALATGKDPASVLPAQFSANESGFTGAYLDGTPCAPDSIATTTDTYMDGMADSGLAKGDADSQPALIIEVSYDGSTYTVHSWNHVRAY